jgi:hypothetical protein
MSVFLRIMNKTKLRWRRWLAANARLKKTIRDAEEQVVLLRANLDELKSSARTTERDVLYAAIGRALTAWAKIEDYLVLIVGRLLRVPTVKAGLLMYSILNFSAWLAIIHGLFEMDETLAPLQKRWGKISERIRKIKDQRDQLAHHSVQMSDQPARLMASPFDARTKTRLQQPLNLQETVDLTDTILGIVDSLSGLMVAMDAALETSPEKSPG